MKSDKSKLRVKYSDDLLPLDSETQTEGCRHSNPDICKNMYISDICAFASADGICKRPPSSWKKQYGKLKNEGGI